MDGATQTQDLGRITDRNWAGAISANDPVGVTAEALQDLNIYFVSIAAAAPQRCIDGRPDPLAQETFLGPQVPGGTPGAALARHLAGGTAGSLVAEAHALIDACLKAGQHPGGHRDDHNQNLPSCGCGAVDKMDAGLQALVSVENGDDLRRLVGALLGESFDQDNFDEVLRRARQLMGQADSFFEDRASSIDYLDTVAPGSAPELRGIHNECFVIVNTVPDTTFATNRFGERYGIQAFGYDFWMTLRDESQLVPEDQRALFITARAMTAVATLMVLTDGSQRLIVRA